MSMEHEFMIGNRLRRAINDDKSQKRDDMPKGERPSTNAKTRDGAT
jgi:hypothetical protein